MSVNLAKKTDMQISSVSSWMRDPNAYDPCARERWFVFNGVRYTAHSLHSDTPDDWPLTIREAISRRYVATVLNWHRLPEELAKRVNG